MEARLASEAGISPAPRTTGCSAAPRSRVDAIVEAARQSTTLYGIVAVQLLKRGQARPRRPPASVVAPGPR